MQLNPCFCFFITVNNKIGLERIPVKEVTEKVNAANLSL
jgi:hypothetical protein